MKRKNPRRKNVVLLKDLSPRQDVKAGAGKRVFGESSERNERTAPPTRGRVRRRRSSKS
ncbi:MAG TPA: hypothetical protein VEO37_12070 [Thermoanaerobaculia bacterium]|nr:hypothetical protein [Thermoanaerobaculia bacterium]